MLKLLATIAVLISFAPEFARCEPLDLGPLDLSETFAGDYSFGGAKDRGEIYVIPNEIEPEKMKPILNRSETGFYISVGAERGFIGAALNPHATHLLLIDLVPDVVLFNRINVALLKASANLSDYLSLRTSGSRDSWLKKAQALSLNQIDRSILESEEFFEKFSRMQKAATERLFLEGYFNGSNYLREPNLFEKLRKMAIEDRIQVHKGNFRDEQMLKRVANEIQKRGSKISILDISNAWERRYTGPKGIMRMVSALSNAMTDQSILLTSEMTAPLEFNMYLWDFFGFRVGTLKKIANIFRSESAMTSLVYSQRSFGSGTVVEPKDLTDDLLRSIDRIDRFGGELPQSKARPTVRYGAFRCEELLSNLK